MNLIYVEIIRKILIKLNLNEIQNGKFFNLVNRIDGDSLINFVFQNSYKTTTKFYKF